MLRGIYDLTLPCIGLAILVSVYCIGSANAISQQAAHLVLPPADLELARKINLLAAGNHVAASAHRPLDQATAQTANP